MARWLCLVPDGDLFAAIRGVLPGVTVALLNRVMHSTPATEVVNLSALTRLDAAFVTSHILYAV